MSYGFEILDRNGRSLLTSNSAAHFMVDVFEITLADGSGQKTYDFLPNQSAVSADWVAYDFSLHFHTPTSWEMRAGMPSVTTAGKTVSWSWQNPGNGGYIITRATVRVFAV